MLKKPRIRRCGTDRQKRDLKAGFERLKFDCEEVKYSPRALQAIATDQGDPEGGFQGDPVQVIFIHKAGCRGRGTILTFRQKIGDEKRHRATNRVDAAPDRIPLIRNVRLNIEPALRDGGTGERGKGDFALNSGNISKKSHSLRERFHVRLEDFATNLLSVLPARGLDPERIGKQAGGSQTEQAAEHGTQDQGLHMVNSATRRATSTTIGRNGTVFSAPGVFFRGVSRFAPYPWRMRSTLPALIGLLLAGALPAQAVRLEKIASDFQRPVQVVFSPGSTGSLYVVEQVGRIVRIQAGRRDLFADLSSVVASGSSETGLLSLAFAPSFREERGGSIYLNYTAGGPLRTEIVEFRAVGNGNPPRLAPASRRLLLRFSQPYANHNGGHLLFGPDGLLYIATGDGGAGGDPQGNGQKPNTFLGKILRIDPRAPQDDRPYTIPANNPFRARPPYLPEIFATGLRNPWRMSFDRATGRLYAGDVGQNRQEEIDLIQAGDNLGWNTMEGDLCFNPRDNCPRAGLAGPLYTYGRDQGVSVTGGFVYRGRALPGFAGQYFFADYGSGRLWSFPVGADGRRAGPARVRLEKAGNISSFGEDNAGELYLVDHSRGEILKIVPAP